MAISPRKKLSFLAQRPQCDSVASQHFAGDAPVVSNYSEQRNQDHGADLDNTLLTLDQQQPLELEGDDREDHAKHGLKHGVVGRIERRQKSIESLANAVGDSPG
jgi:hypothetical protein